MEADTKAFVFLRIYTRHSVGRLRVWDALQCRPYPKNCWQDSSHLKPSAVPHTAEAPISRQEAVPALAWARQDNGRSGTWCRQVPLCCQADGHTLLKRLTAVLHPRNSTLLSTATSSESNPVYPSQALCNGLTPVALR